jgi:hypothetical protein
MSEKPIVDIRAVNYPILVDGYVQYDKKTGEKLMRHEIEVRREGEEEWHPIKCFNKELGED